MATTIVHTSKKIGRALDYAGNNNRKPHHRLSKDPALNNRVLATSGINCSSNYKMATIQMEHTLKKSGINSKSLQSVNTIISADPKQYKWKNPKDRLLFMNHVKTIIHNKYPNNQSFIALQADNKNHILHAHCITCARRFDDGRSIDHQATWRKTVPFVDQEFSKDKNFTPASPIVKYQTKSGKTFKMPKKSQYKYSAGEIDHIRKGDSWFNNYRREIDISLGNSSNFTDLEHSLDNLGITFEPWRTHKVNGQKHQLHIYKQPSQKYISKKVEINGQRGYLHAKRQPSFSFVRNGKRYRVRGSRLGTSYSMEAIQHQLQVNHHNLIIQQQQNLAHSQTKKQSIKASKKNISDMMSQYENTLGKHGAVNDFDMYGIPKHVSTKNGSQAKNKPNKVYKIYLHHHTVPAHKVTHHIKNIGPITNTIPARTYSRPMIKIPHFSAKPLMPMIKKLSASGNDEDKKLSAELLNQINEKDFEQKEQDYRANVATAQSNANQQNADAKAKAHQEKLDIIKEIRNSRGFQR